MKYNELMMQTDSKLKNTVTIINRKEFVTMSGENKNTQSEYEYTFPDEYPRPARAEYATEEEWQAACKKKLPTQAEWLEYILNKACFISQTEVQRLLGLTGKTVKDNIRPCVPHLNLMDDKSRYNEAYFLYDKQELKKFLLQPEKLQRRSIYINMYAYPELISEGTIKMVQDFLKLKKAGKRYRQSDITSHLKAFFEPFYVAHCRDNTQGKVIREQCPLMECSLEEDVELEQLWTPEEKGKKLEQAVFEQGLIQAALFGYTIRQGRPAANSRRFIRPSKQHEEQAEPENGEQWVLVGYEAWQRFLKQPEAEAVAPEPEQQKGVEVEAVAPEPEQQKGVEAEAAAQSKEPLEENKDFTRIADEVVSGKVKHLFITGEAGTGKTVCICKLVKELLEAGKQICLCATTGIAADNLNNDLPEYFRRAGCKDEKLWKDVERLKCRTVHDAFKIEPDQPVFYNRFSLDIMEESNTDIETKDIFIIDEISMLRMDVFSKVMSKIYLAEQKCAEQKCKDRVLCEKQVIVVGDFFQLPPVITEDDKKMLLLNGWPESCVEAGGYCFFSPWWRSFKTEELKQNYRQKADSEFLDILRVIRTGDRKRLKTAVAWLNKQRVDDNAFTNSISIVSKKAVADSNNLDALKKLPGAVWVYEYKYESKNKSSSVYKDEIERQMQSINIRPILELKVGAKVMATKNDFQKRFVNGSMGIVTELGENYVKVKFDGKKDIIDVTRAKFDIFYNRLYERFGLKRVAGYVQQFPLQLAYAITIHKSQGLTLAKAKISPGSWENGQLYTALSRVKSAQGLCLTAEVKEKHMQASDKVQDFYAGKNLALPMPGIKNRVITWDSVAKKLKKDVKNYRAHKQEWERSKSETKRDQLKQEMYDLSEKITKIVIETMLEGEKISKIK